MKVHLITSRGTLENHENDLRQVISNIHSSGHVLTSNWIDEALEWMHKNDYSTADWKNIYKSNLENVAETDVVIAEASFENFGVGYQVAAAVQQKKPILLLRHASADENAFVTGVEDGWVRHEVYDEKNLDNIIKKFLEENDISTKDMRFNFFIDRPIYNYLRWASLKTGKTKAEILRELVQQEIDKKES
jgi:hypothetical protein